jgi:phage-related tail protein
MADEIRMQTPGQGGNGFLFDLKEKKLGLTGPNVALLLLIIGMLGVGWLRTGKIDDTLKTIPAQIAATETRVSQRVETLFARIDKVIEDVQEQNTVLNANNGKLVTALHNLQAHTDEGLAKQNELVHSQTQAIAVLLETVTHSLTDGFAAARRYTEDWFSEMGRRQELMNFNALNPEKALPLRAPHPDEERHQERGR